MKLPYQIDLSDKVVAVTGAGGVLMSEFCRALAACGAKVALLDINEAAAKAVADEIGENAIAVGTNCLDKASIEAAAERVHQAFGRVNFLINGAGGNNPRATCDNETMTPETDDAVKSFFGLEESGLKFVFDLNITSAFLVTQVFAKDMVQTGGNIINISSMNAFRPLTKIPAYSAAKAGISNFTEWLAVHFAPCGIRVNAIAPGFFVTNQNRALLFDADGNPTARTGKILAATPQKRFGEVSDLIGTLLWLASDDASGFVTGVISRLTAASTPTAASEHDIAVDPAPLHKAGVNPEHIRIGGRQIERLLFLFSGDSYSDRSDIRSGQSPITAKKALSVVSKPFCFRFPESGKVSPLPRRARERSDTGCRKQPLPHRGDNAPGEPASPFRSPPAVPAPPMHSG